MLRFCFSSYFMGTKFLRTDSSTVTAILGALRHSITHPSEKVEEAPSKEGATVRNFIDAYSPKGLG